MEESTLELLLESWVNSSSRSCRSVPYTTQLIHYPHSSLRPPPSPSPPPLAPSLFTFHTPQPPRVATSTTRHPVNHRLTPCQFSPVNLGSCASNHLSWGICKTPHTTRPGTPARRTRDLQFEKGLMKVCVCAFPSPESYFVFSMIPARLPQLRLPFAPCCQ